MRHLLAVWVAAVMLAGASVAFAAPQALSSAEMDSISAGDSALAQILPAGIEDVEVSVDGVALANNHSNAVVGDFSEMGLFASRNDYSAVAVGHANEAFAVNQSSFVANGSYPPPEVVTTSQPNGNFNGRHGVALFTGDNLHLLATYNSLSGDGDGSNYVIGECNEMYAISDESEVEGEIEDDAYGVIAREAEVEGTGSFNKSEVELCLEACIDDSFNGKSKTLAVVGMEGSTAIVLAAALDDQCIGVNLNVTNATIAVGDGGDGFETDVPGVEAETFAQQVAFNDSCLEDSDDNFKIEE